MAIENLDALTLIKKALLAEIQKTLFKEILEEKLSEMEIEISARIKPLIERITLDRVDAIKDCMKLGEQVDLHVRARVLEPHPVIYYGLEAHLGSCKCERCVNRRNRA